MTETEFEQAVVDLAHTFGWHAAGFRPARTLHGWRTPVKHDAKGFPDLVLAHPKGRVVFAELKVGANKPDADQRVWADILGPSYRCWWPSDADQIASTLSHGRVSRWILT